ncbi:MAG: zinc-dependent metalloprotease [Propionibacteriaceae bacterium]|nr:zinc-dependent metalloprotease [Propionibacteriaceae bacterium]
MADVINWDVARRTGIRRAKPGPDLPADERARIVERLREAAQRSVVLVAEATGLTGDGSLGETLVVDRTGIVRTNASVMALTMEKVATEQDEVPGFVASATGRVAGLVLGFLGTNILGQYEPFSQRLLLNAPAIERVRDAIGADLDDFTLWVCLHEQTHRQQFAAAPWLPDYLLRLMQGLAGSTTGQEKATVASALRKLKNPAASIPGEITAVMSLLEGYADMLMDQAGAAVIGSLPSIRKSFDQRRAESHLGFQGLINRLFGLAMKHRQYADGKKFCEAVCREVGLEGLNRAFAAPEYLPTEEELHNPSAWVARLRLHEISEFLSENGVGAHGEPGKSPQ